jgi:broad specificity phosphatase PhoE
MARMRVPQPARPGLARPEPAQLVLVRHAHVTDNTAGALSLRPRRRAALCEISAGALEGWPVAEVARHFPQLWARHLAQDDEDAGWPGGETYRHFRTRVLRAVRRIAAAHAGRRVVLVTHAGVIGQVVGWLRGAGAARWEVFRPRNASITELEWAGPTGRVLRFDDAAHLQHVRS